MRGSRNWRLCSGLGWSCPRSNSTDGLKLSGVESFDSSVNLNTSFSHSTAVLACQMLVWQGSGRSSALVGSIEERMKCKELLISAMKMLYASLVTQHVSLEGSSDGLT